MSKKEFDRLEVLLGVQSGRLRVADACVLIGLQRRQVFRLLRGLKQDGTTSPLCKRRARPSNHRLSACGSHPGVIDCARAIFRLWPELGSGEAGRASWQFRSRSSCPPPTGVSSLPCATGDISTMRRHNSKARLGRTHNRLIWGRTPRHETFISSEILRTGTLHCGWQCCHSVGQC
jgi:hypothetical protein